MEGTTPTQSATPSQHMVPRALISIRRFLFEFGMPVVPWAPVKEVLDQFHELLCSCKVDDRFWRGLHGLLDELQNDLHERLLKDGQTLDALPAAEQSSLINEIRSKLSSASEELSPAEQSTGGFLKFARRLSRSSLVALLLLSGAATIGCGANKDSNDNNNNNQQPDASGCYNSDGIKVSSMTDLSNVIDTCIPAGETRNQIHSCLATLSDSWQKSIEEYLNCQTCSEAAHFLQLLPPSCSELPSLPPAPCYVDRSICIIYSGVRFD